jgi:hypothetical protein
MFSNYPHYILTVVKCQGSIVRAVLFLQTFLARGEIMSMSLTLNEFGQLILLSWGKHDGPLHLHLVDGSGQGANGMQIDHLIEFAPKSTAYLQLERFHSFPLLSHIGLEKARWVFAVVDLTPDLQIAREVVNFIVTNGHQDRVRLVVFTDSKQWSQKQPWVARMTSYVPDFLFVRDACIRGRCIPTVLGGVKNLLQKKRERLFAKRAARSQSPSDDFELLPEHELR